MWSIADKNNNKKVIYCHLCILLLYVVFSSQNVNVQGHQSPFNFYRQKRNNPCFISSFQTKQQRQDDWKGKKGTYSNRKHGIQEQVIVMQKQKQLFKSLFSNQNSNDDEKAIIDPNTLMDMDIIIYQIKDDPDKKSYIGAIQEDMTLAPLSAWTTEPAFGTYIEFVVDEEDRWRKELELENIIVIDALLDDNLFSYGSRQVGGGKGLGNPHGEESELLYYIEQKVLEQESIEIPIKPELEILW